MANTVQANFEVNAKMNTSSVDDGVKDVINQFNVLSSQIDAGLNGELKISEQLLNDLKNQFTGLSNSTLNLEGLVPEAQFEKAIELVFNLKEKLEQLKVTERDLSVGEFGGFINQLSSAFELTEQEANALKEEESIRQSLVDKINAEYNAYNDLTNQANVYNDEVIDTGDYVKNIAEQIEEVKKREEEAAAILNDFSYPGEQLEEDKNKVNDYSKVVELLGSKLGLSNNEANAFAKALGASAGEAAAAGAAIGVIVGVLKLYIDRLHEAENALIKFSEGALDAGVSGVEFFVDAIHSLIDSLEEAMEKMDEFAEKGAEIQTAYFNTFTVLGSEAGNEVMSFADKLEHLYGLDGDELIEDMQSLVAAAGSLGVNTGDMVKATENMTIMANDLSMLAGSFEKASNDIGNAISKGFVGRNSSLYVLMTKQEKDALKELGSEVERYNYLMELSSRIKDRYVQYLGTEAGQLMLLKAQYGQLVNNISKLALGLYAKIAPVLNKLIQLANIALTFIMRVFNIDLKGSADIGTSSIADGIANTMKSAGDSSEKAEKKISKSTKKSAKAIKELEKQVASFDDVIQINDNKANDDLLGLDDLGDLDADLDGLDGSPIQDMIKDFDLLGDAIGDAEDEFAEFKKLLDEGKYYEAGQWLAGWLADQLESIPWDDIQKKAKETGKSLAEFLNGFNSDKRLWADIGHTIAEALNTAVDFLLEFGRTFDWKEFGDSLGVAWKQFWEDFDKVEAGQALYEWVMGAIEMAGSFFATNPLTTMAESIVAMIHEFFNSFTEADKEELAETVKNILTDVFNAGLTLAEGLLEDTDSILDFINTILDSAIEWLDNPDNTTIQDIGQAIIGILNKVKDSGIITKIGDIIRKFIDEIDLGGILEAAMDIAFEIWRIKTELMIQKWWEEVKAVVGNLDIPRALLDLWYLIETALALIGVYGWLTIKGIIDTIWGVLKGFGEDIAAKFTEKRIELAEWFSKVKHDIGVKFDEIKGHVVEKFEGILNKVKEWIGKIKDAIVNPFKNLNPFSGMNFKLPSFHISLPYSGQHAKGGVTNGASIGMIGEAGREAILPLDKYTNWMDELASKINSNNSNNGNSVIIDMSKISKPFYSRSEMIEFGSMCAEAMEASGMRVSRVY